MRDAHNVMRSTVGCYAEETRHRRYVLARGTLNLAHHNKEIIRFARRSKRVHLVRFEDIKRDPEKVFRDVCRFLELEFEPGLLEEAYRPNTTFAGGRERSRVLSASDKHLIDLTMSLSRYYVPTHVFRAVKRVSSLRAEKPLPKWFFSTYPPVFEPQAQAARNTLTTPKPARVLDTSAARHTHSGRHSPARPNVSRRRADPRPRSHVAD